LGAIGFPAENRGAVAGSCQNAPMYKMEEDGGLLTIGVLAPEREGRSPQGENTQQTEQDEGVEGRGNK